MKRTKYYEVVGNASEIGWPVIDVRDVLEIDDQMYLKDRDRCYYPIQKSLAPAEALDRSAAIAKYRGALHAVIAEAERRIADVESLP